MVDKPNEATEILGETHAPIENVPDPTAEEAQRALAQANGGTAAPEKRDEPAPKPKDPEVKSFEDPRKAIADAHRARRQSEMKGTTEDYNDQRLTDPQAGLVSESQAAADAANGVQPQAQADQPAPRMVKVTVDGQEREIPEAELISSYQKNSAVDYRLQKATEAQKAAEALLARAQNPTGTMDGNAPPTKPGHESGSDRTSPAPTDAKKDTPTDEADVSDEALLDVVEKMQIGSTDEAVKALKKVLHRPAPQAQAADIGTEVEKTIALREENLKSAAALEKFGTKYTAAKTNKVVEAAMSQLVRDELVADLKAAGVPDQFISHFRLTEPEGKAVLMESHKHLRAAGHEKVRTVDQVLGAVEKNADFQRLIAANVQPSPKIEVDRGERKAGVQAQPALRSAAPPPSNKQPAPADRAAKQSSAVENMRKQRGLPAYGA